MAVTLESYIPEFLSSLNKNIEESIIDIGERVFQLTQNKCPIRTGYLKSTGDISYIKLGFVISYSAEYAKYVEYKKNFIRDSYIEMEDEIINNVGSAINHSINSL